MIQIKCNLFFFFMHFSCVLIREISPLYFLPIDLYRFTQNFLILGFLMQGKEADEDSAGSRSRKRKRSHKSKQQPTAVADNWVFIRDRNIADIKFCLTVLQSVFCPDLMFWHSNLLILYVAYISILGDFRVHYQMHVSFNGFCFLLPLSNVDHMIRASPWI